MISEHLTILDGETEIVRLWGNGAKSSGNEDHIFTELNGWRDQKIEISTVPKLFGQGSYLTEVARPSRELSLTVWVKQESRLGLHTAFLTALRQFRTLTWRLVSTDSSNEEINVVLTSVGEPMRYSDGTTTFTIEGTALNPDPENIDDLPALLIEDHEMIVELGQTYSYTYSVINGEDSERISITEINGLNEELGLEEVEDENAFTVSPTSAGTYVVEVIHFRESDLRQAVGNFTVIVPEPEPPSTPIVEYVRQDPGFVAVFRFQPVLVAESYEVEYNIDNTEWIAHTVLTPNTDIEIEAAPNIPIEVRVKAYNDGMESEWGIATGTMFTEPEQPEWITLEIDGTDIRIRYGTVANASTYEVRYYFDIDEYTYLPDTTPETDFLIPIKEDSETFTVEVQAVNVAGSSGWNTDDISIP